jgi:hypothetical protein
LKKVYVGNGKVIKALEEAGYRRVNLSDPEEVQFLLTVLLGYMERHGKLPMAVICDETTGDVLVAAGEEEVGSFIYMEKLFSRERQKAR